MGIDVATLALAKQYVKENISSTFKPEIVESLPSSGKDGILYLVPNKEDGTYKEYLWIKNKWEQIGDSDCSAYLKKDELADWAKATNPPTAEQVGAVPEGTFIPTEEAFNAKAEKTYVDTQLGTKADSSAIPDVTGLATKEEVTQRLSTKVDKVEGSRLITTPEAEKLNRLKEINPVSKNEQMTTPIGIDPSGKLWTNSKNQYLFTLGGNVELEPGVEYTVDLIKVDGTPITVNEIAEMIENGVDVGCEIFGAILSLSQYFNQPTVLIRFDLMLPSINNNIEIDTLLINDSDQAHGIYTTKYVTSGGSGTSDYANITNKPQINGVPLEGNKTTADLGIEAGVTSVNGMSGDVTLDSVFYVTGKLDIANPKSLTEVSATYEEIKTAYLANKNVCIKAKLFNAADVDMNDEIIAHMTSWATAPSGNKIFIFTNIYYLGASMGGIINYIEARIGEDNVNGVTLKPLGK